MENSEKKPGRLRRLFSFYDVKAWVNIEDNKTIFDEIMNIFRTLFLPKTDTKANERSFVEASQRFSLDEIKLNQMKIRFRLYARLLVLAGLAFLPYAIYLASRSSWHSMILTLVLSLLAFAQAFRFHFWYFQIEKRKLGCTFGEWLREGLLKIGSSS